jgi:hypothetical protein
MVATPPNGITLEGEEIRVDLDAFRGKTGKFKIKLEIMGKMWNVDSDGNRVEELIEKSDYEIILYFEEKEVIFEPI